VPPAVMGIGPAVAIPMALERAGVTRESVDVYEINEAFASQAVYCIRKLGLDPAKVNPNGGAIALGHPLGCTGARQVGLFLLNNKYGTCIVLWSQRPPRRLTTVFPPLLLPCPPGCHAHPRTQASRGPPRRGFHVYWHRYGRRRRL